MMSYELLIMGIDPGTTLGYALINTDGKLVDIGSSKNIGLGTLISKIIGIGKIIAVGTDKKEIPSFIREFSAKLGARIISPEEDAKVAEKKRLAANFKAEDYHQMDALASAFIAYNELFPLLRKIDGYVKKNKKEGIKKRIVELVVTKGISISEAVRFVERPAKEEDLIIHRVVEEKKLREFDFIRLYSKLKRAEKEIFLLKSQRSRLWDEMENTRMEYKKMLERISRSTTSEKARELIEFKEKRIHFFGRELKNKDTEISGLRNEIKKLVYFLSNLNDNCIIKKTGNLGYDEFARKKFLLNISSDEILMVDDPNVSSEGVVEGIKNRTRIII